MLKLIITLIFVFNILTAWVVRNLKGKFKVRTWINYDAPPSGKKVCLVSGFRNQPDVAFGLIDFSRCRKIVWLMYSNFGFNMNLAARQMYEVCTAGYGTEVFAISFGAMVHQHANLRKGVLIDPCINPEVILEPYRQKFRRNAIIYGALSAILGWLAFIPVIPVEKPALSGIALSPVRYSLALLADQMYYIGYSETKVKESRGVTLVLSNYDGLLDNERIIRDFRAARVIMIPAGHADTLANPEPYQKVLEPLLE